MLEMNDIKNLRDIVYKASEVYGDEIYIKEYIKKDFKDTSFKTFRENCDSVAVWIQEKFNSRIHAAIIGTTSSEYLTHGSVFSAAEMYPFR